MADIGRISPTRVYTGTLGNAVGRDAGPREACKDVS